MWPLSAPRAVPGCVPLRLRNLLPDIASLAEICKNGFSSLIKHCLSSVATIMLNTSAALFGDAAVAAFTVVSRLVHIGQMIYFGISDGYQPVCSYNYGVGFVMLQGIGRNGPAAILGSGRQGLFLVPLLLILPRIWGLNGLIAVQPCSDILATLLSAVILRPNLRRLRQMEEEKLNSTIKES